MFTQIEAMLDSAMITTLPNTGAQKSPRLLCKCQFFNLATTNDLSTCTIYFGKRIMAPLLMPTTSAVSLIGVERGKVDFQQMGIDNFHC